MLAKLSFLQTSLLVLVLVLVGVVPLISALRKGVSRIKGVTTGPRVWSDLAARLGLGMPNPGQLALQGAYRGTDVRATVRTADTSTQFDGNRRSKDYFTVVSAAIKPPLGLALTIVAPRGELLGNTDEARPVALEHREFDRAFAVRGRDPQRVERLLLARDPDQDDGTILGQLADLHRTLPRIRISDHEVRLEQAEIVQDPERLKSMLDAAVSLSSRLSRLRRG